MIRLSIIMPFLNSHEIVRRQLIYMRQQDYPDDVEIIFMDDGSKPPLEVPENPPKNFTLHATNDFRPWTSSIARNTGVKLAKGEYLFMVDGDYIISRAAVEIARQFDEDRLGCRREFGVLTEDGTLTQDRNVLMEYGLPLNRIKSRGAKLPPHPNHYVMRKAVYEEIGGYDEARVLSGCYPQGEDNLFKRTWRTLQVQGKLRTSETERPVLYMFPNGQFCGDVDYNPFNLFHGLTRKTDRNYWFRHPRYTRDAT